MTAEVLPSSGEQFVRDMAKAKADAGADWDRKAMVEFCDRWLAQLKASQKRERTPKIAISGQAQAIYDAYPRKIAPAAAKLAISRAISAGEDIVALLRQTSLYAKCVANWPKSYRFDTVTGQDKCPHPATWFNRGSYNDDPKEWYGPKGSPNSHLREPNFAYPEPDGWREEFPDCVYPTWDEVPTSSKSHICTVLGVAAAMSVPPDPASHSGLLFPEREKAG